MSSIPGNSADRVGVRVCIMRLRSASTRIFGVTPSPAAVRKARFPILTRAARLIAGPVRLIARHAHRRDGTCRRKNRCSRSARRSPCGIRRRGKTACNAVPMIGSPTRPVSGAGRVAAAPSLSQEVKAQAAIWRDLTESRPQTEWRYRGPGTIASAVTCSPKAAPHLAASEPRDSPKER